METHPPHTGIPAVDLELARLIQRESFSFKCAAGLVTLTRACLWPWRESAASALSWSRGISPLRSRLTSPFAARSFVVSDARAKDCPIVYASEGF